MEIKTIITTATSIIRKYVPPQSVMVLFGSQATGAAYDGSDIDIGIMGDTVVPFETMTKILDDIEDIPTLRKIDIVDLRAVSTPLREHILSYAKRI